ncbi:MAG: sulfurtransferase, partial [Pseudomonadota bacterium]
ASPALADEPGYANPTLLTSAASLDQMRAAATADLVVLDVRSADKFAEGHIPGALNLPFTALTDPEAHIEGALKADPAIASMLGALGVDAKTQVVLYDDQGGFRAARLFWLMEYYGHRSVSILDGGIQAWTAEDLALSTNASDRAPEFATFAVNHTPRRFASALDILERRNDRDTVVVDVRPTAAFDKGHIPWAQSLPWKGNLDADGTMKSAEDLAAHFAAHGIEGDEAVIIHCQTGEASAHSYFALRLIGHPQVRVYHRSWAEWGAASDLPKTISADG